MELDLWGRIEELRAHGEYALLAAALDEAELQDPQKFATDQWPRAIHLLSLIYVSDLEGARFLYKRLQQKSSRIDNDMEVQQAFVILQRLWVKDFEALWPALEVNWSDNVRPLAIALKDRSRQAVTDLVAEAYVELSLGKLASLLGLRAEEAEQVALERGWEVADGTVHPKVHTIEMPAQSIALEHLGAYLQE